MNTASRLIGYKHEVKTVPNEVKTVPNQLTAYPRLQHGDELHQKDLRINLLFGHI